MQALLLNFRHQGKKAIEKVARNQPAVYLKILALLVPGEMKFEHSGGVKAMTDEQLEAAVEALQAMLDGKLSGESAKVIEGGFRSRWRYRHRSPRQGAKHARLWARLWGRGCGQDRCSHFLKPRKTRERASRGSPAPNAMANHQQQATGVPERGAADDMVSVSISKLGAARNFLLRGARARRASHTAIPKSPLTVCRSPAEAA